MTPIMTTRRIGRSAFRRILFGCLSVAVLAAACPLPQANYVLRTSGKDWLRVGPAADGEMILSFTLRDRRLSIPLAQVIDRIRFERLDADGKQVPPDLTVAPAYIRISGLAKISDVPDGEWRLAWCGKPSDP